MSLYFGRVKLLKRKHKLRTEFDLASVIKKQGNMQSKKGKKVDDKSNKIK